MITSIRNKRIFAVLTGMFLLTVSVSALAIYIGQEIMTPEFARAEYRPMTMVMIPPRAAVSKDSMFSSHELIEQGGIVEDAVLVACKDIFDKLGYEVRILSVDEVNADKDLQVMVRNVNKRYDEARILADRLGVEAIIVGRIEVAAAAGGASVFSLGTSGEAEMSIGIIAGDNGDLEAFFTGAQLGLSAKKIEKKPLKTMAKLSANVLKDYPTPDELIKVKKSWLQTTNRKVPDAALSDEDILSDMEAMFEQPEEDATPAVDEAN
jgi:hypothetical protein